ncbi:MAG: hypothetical protein KJO98_15265 [Rhodothermia bacterium]|nr:hypothetical protein [Rhodothermia bacterium]
MKRLIPAISLAVVMLSVMPVEAQTLTRVNRSDVFTRATANRTASIQRNQQQMRKRSQTLRARKARTKQTQALRRLKQRSKLGARTQPGVQTIVGTKREIALSKRRIQRQKLNKLPNRGNAQMRVIKRRLATDAEARMHRPKRVVR